MANAMDVQPRAAQPALPAPRGIKVWQDGPRLRISYGWLRLFGTSSFVSTSYLLMSSLAILAIPGIPMLSSDMDLGKLHYLFVATRTKAEVIGFLLLACSYLGGVYVFVAFLMNRTVIDSEPGKMEIRHGPLPWPSGTPTFAVADMDCIYCERVHHGGGGKGMTTYDVCVVLRSGARRKLMTGFPDPVDAVFIEQTIERHLGLHHWPVPGEFRLEH